MLATTTCPFFRSWEQESQQIVFNKVGRVVFNWWENVLSCHWVIQDTKRARSFLIYAECRCICITFSKEPPLLSTSFFWVWAAPSTTPTLWSLSKNWVSILKELRSLPPSSMCTLWTLLLILSILDVPFPVLLPTLIRSQFQAKPVTLLIAVISNYRHCKV